MPPNPPSNAHGFAMRSMSLRDMQIPKSEKKILGPPLPNPGDAPEWHEVYKWCNMTYYSISNCKGIITYCTLHVVTYELWRPPVPFKYRFHYDLTLYICHIINSLEFMPPCTRFVTPQYKVEY